MKMTSFENLDKDQKIRATIQRDVQSICTEACHFLGLDITKPAMELILDVFFHKMTLYADDLEKFAKHAKRTTINSDDCRLLTRRNASLTDCLNSLKLPVSSAKEPAKRRRTATASAASSPKRARPPENVTKLLENTNRMLEKSAGTSENVARRNEDFVETDANEAIDLTFD